MSGASALGFGMHFGQNFGGLMGGSGSGVTTPSSDGELVVGAVTTWTDQVDHNTSASDDYNQFSVDTGVQDNFNGFYHDSAGAHPKDDSKFDDSFNMATPKNVSKKDHATLLYLGATTKNFAHAMPWWGGPGHVDIGYESDSLSQADAQIADVVSRGFEGIIVDWYGEFKEPHETATQYLLAECESQSAKLIMCHDQGALVGYTDFQQKLIDDLNYINDNYAISAAYEKVGGVPVVLFFGHEAWDIDWAEVRAGLTSPQKWLFQNAGGFTHTESDGAFAWIQPSLSTLADPIASDYLENFYATALANPSKIAMGAAYPGFNSTMATWEPNRHMPQRSGRTWLDTWAKVNEYFSSSNQLDYMQAVTWNDYEEGTEIETGIENNGSLAAAMDGDVLEWTWSGGPIETVSVFTVFFGTDGMNFEVLGNFDRTTFLLDLAAAMAGEASGAYKFRVKAFGEPSIVNKWSGEVSWTKP
jgi:hypothetical protein